jgi:hypothetical protein
LAFRGALVGLGFGVDRILNDDDVEMHGVEDPRSELRGPVWV